MPLANAKQGFIGFDGAVVSPEVKMAKVLEAPLRISKRRVSAATLAMPDWRISALRPAAFKQPPIVPTGALLPQGQSVQPIWSPPSPKQNMSPWVAGSLISSVIGKISMKPPPPKARGGRETSRYVPL